MRIALSWLDLADPTDRVVAAGLARALSGAGHEICLVGPRRRGGEPFRDRFEGASVYRVGFPFLSRLPLLNDAVAALQLRAVARREAIDVWQCHVFARGHRAFVWGRRLSGRPMVAAFHAVLADYLPFLGGPAGLRRFAGEARAVAAVSRASRAELEALAPELEGRCSVIYNGAPELPPAAPEARPGPYILAIGRLAPYKGFDVLLMAFSKLLEREPGARLVICGRDQLKGGLARFIAALGLGGKVELLGEASRERIAGLLRGCAFFVMPSRRENFPLALLEAMAAGKAVVATSVGGIPELVREGRDGFLTAAGDVAALTRRMADLAASPERAASLGREARERALAFAWTKAAEGYLRLCESALRGGPVEPFIAGGGRAPSEGARPARGGAAQTGAQAPVLDHAA